MQGRRQAERDGVSEGVQGGEMERGDGSNTGQGTMTSQGRGRWRRWRMGGAGSGRWRKKAGGILEFSFQFYSYIFTSMTIL